MSVTYSRDGLVCVLGVDGRIKSLASEVIGSGRGLLDVAQNSDRWLAVGNAAMNTGARENARKLLTS